MIRNGAGAILMTGVLFVYGAPPETPERPETPAAPAATAEADPAYVLGYTMERIDGAPARLADYEGSVVVIVNVASRCGLTPQYAGLEKLYRTHKDRGLVVLGFPANDFRGQEPGSNAEIAEFCSATYGVTFPMFAKISVTGDDRHELYTRLTTQPEPIGGAVEWNFQKYLVGRDGRVVAKFEPRTAPDDPEFVAAVERLLAE